MWLRGEASSRIGIFRNMESLRCTDFGGTEVSFAISYQNFEFALCLYIRRRVCKHDNSNDALILSQVACARVD